MKKLKFKPEDFRYNSHNLGEFGAFIRLKYAANVAQKLFDEWFKQNVEGAPSFELTKTEHGYREWTDSGLLGTLTPTHTCKLVCIQEIK